MYSNVNDLVAGLRRGENDAHQQFERLCSEPIARMIDRVAGKAHSYRESLHQRAIAWAKMYLRSCEETKFDAMSFKVSRLFVVVAVSKMLLEPTGEAKPDGPDPEPIPGGPHYQIEVLPRPHGHLDGNWLGGDWLGGDLLDDGTVWILVADVSGKGKPANIIARGLPLLWRIRSADALRSRKCEPVDLLDLLGRELNSCLPDGIFVEATAARLGPDGNVSVGAAGATRVILRRHGACSIALQQFGGPFLGIDIPVARSQELWKLNAGDELLMATDGLFDQPTHDGRLVQNLAKWEFPQVSSLLRAIHTLLERIRPRHAASDAASTERRRPIGGRTATLADSTAARVHYRVDAAAAHRDIQNGSRTARRTEPYRQAAEAFRERVAVHCATGA